MSKPKMVCDAHQVKLESYGTRFGKRWQCPVAGCTVASWEGQTSTPADDETRALRIKCHAIFDTLFGRHGVSEGKRFRNRRTAYEWLASTMGLGRDKAHIGMFNKEQCERLLRELEVTK